MNSANRPTLIGLTGRIQIEFISPQGYAEVGIDGGGLFKEFMDSCAKAVFSSESGCEYFVPTNQQLLTINPETASALKNIALINVATPSSTANNANVNANRDNAVATAGAANAPNDNDRMNVDDEDDEEVTLVRYNDFTPSDATNLDYYHFIGKILGKATYDVSYVESIQNVVLIDYFREFYWSQSFQGVY